MPIHNPKIDAYIEKAQPFAQPILNHIRELVHKTCPQVEEKIKWGFPHFDYKNEMMCSMAAFKQHCAFNLWKASLMNDPILMAKAKSEQSMGHMGKITSLKDLPNDKKLIGYIKEAMKLNDDGIKIIKPPKTNKATYTVPSYIIAAIKKSKQAYAAFTAFSPSHQKEYAIWIDEAKTEVTKQKRIAQAIEWLAQGKSRNWKYERK